MTAMRTKPLPQSPATGPLIVPRPVLDETGRQLRRSRGDDGQHEGLVFWIGRRIDADTYVLAAIAPRTEHAPKRVMVGPGEVGKVARTARRRRLAIVAQVHSHPGSGSRHSDGDDDLILMPHDGLFSIVAANYGACGFATPDSFSIHQFQDGRWVLVNNTEDCLVVVDSLLQTDA